MLSSLFYVVYVLLPVLDVLSSLLYVVYVFIPVLDVFCIWFMFCFQYWMLSSLLYVVYVLLPVLDVEQFVVCGLCFTSSTGC